MVRQENKKKLLHKNVYFIKHRIIDIVKSTNFFYDKTNKNAYVNFDDQNMICIFIFQL